MKHKLICLILCLLLLPSLFLSVGAEQQYVIDNADLMSSSEEAALEEKAQALAKLGVFSLYDLVSYFPRKYEDRSTVMPIALTSGGESVCIEALVADTPRLTACAAA